MNIEENKKIKKVRIYKKPLIKTKTFQAALVGFAGAITLPLTNAIYDKKLSKEDAAAITVASVSLVGVGAGRVNATDGAYTPPYLPGPNKGQRIKDDDDENDLTNHP